MPAFINPEYFQAGSMEASPSVIGKLHQAPVSPAAHLIEIGDIARGWLRSGDSTKTECANEIIAKICSIPIP